jgi:hypothetical protein
MGSVVVLLIWIGAAALGHAIGKGKGRGTEGLLLGLFLGLIGVIIIVFLRPKTTASSGPMPIPNGSNRSYLPEGERPPAFWAEDPYGRHQLRWWNGTVWTQQVSDSGFQSIDSVGVGPPPPPISLH